MPSRPLRGERYAKGVNPDLIRTLTDVLPFMTYNEAACWYGEALRKQVPQEWALVGCNDRFFLLTVLLRREDATHSWLYDRCREVEARPDGYLDLWARFHFKSTIITFAGGIQEALCDPEIRIGILSNTKDISEKFVAQIKGELETNELLVRIYSDVLWDKPRRDAPSWSVDKGLTLKRKGNPKEATFEAHGLDALPTGRHFPLLIYDDVITLRNVSNPEQINKATVGVEMSDNLGDLGCTRKWFIGTRYSFADTYGQLLEHQIAIPRIYPATHNGRLDGKPVLLSDERWAEVKKAQRTTVAAQMLQNPTAGQDNLFRAEWLKGFYVRPAMMNVYIMADPSLGIHKTSDRTAMAVVGIDSNLNKYLLDGFCHRMNLTEKWKNLRDLHKKWSNMHGVQLVKVGYERYGQQADAQYFEERMKEEGVRFNIEELNWTRNRQGESKAHRVGRLEPDFTGGSFFVQAKVWYPGATISPEIKAKIAEGKIAQPHGNTALWSVTEEGKISYRAYIAPHEDERRIRARGAEGARWRLTEPIRRIDEDDNIYDLTRVFFEEYLFFPFSPRDDLVDATSRIYDMDPQSAEIIEANEPKSYPDD